MAFATGTITALNDVLDVLATFLISNGWDIDGNWLEPVFVRNQIVSTPSPPAPAEKWWRYGRRLHAHKGAIYISAQDFWYTYDFSYGTTNNPGLQGALQGPGISLTVATDVSVISLGNTADHPLSGYNGGGPAFPNFFNQPGVPVNGAGTPRTFVMPLPLIGAQPLGRWRPSIPGGANNIMDATSGLSNPGGDPLLPVAFLTPMKYWLFSDVTGTNIMMVIDRTGVDYSWIPVSPYLYFGDIGIMKGGSWTGGIYAGASHGNSAVFELVLDEPYHCARFGPPGALRDGGGCATVIRMDVDSWVGNWVGLMGNSTDASVGTGRGFASTTVLDPKPTDPFQNILGLPDLAVLPMTLRKRSSTIANGAVCLPTYWFVKRDSGLWSVMGILPDVFQAKIKGISLGMVDGEDPSMFYFDGFGVHNSPTATLVKLTEDGFGKLTEDGFTKEME